MKHHFTATLFLFFLLVLAGMPIKLPAASSSPPQTEISSPPSSLKHRWKKRKAFQKDVDPNAKAAMNMALFGLGLTGLALPILFLGVNILSGAALLLGTLLVLIACIRGIGAWVRLKKQGGKGKKRAIFAALSPLIWAVINYLSLVIVLRDGL